MSDIWVSTILKGRTASEDPGFTYKYFDSDWYPVEGGGPLPSEAVLSAVKRHARGERLERAEMVEACYVHDMDKFEKMGDFSFAGGFIFIRGEFAKVLSDMDLGKWELVPYTIYGTDKETPLEEDFYLINYGGYKDCFLPQQSRNIKPIFTLARNGKELWRNRSAEDNDIAISSKAIGGADLWMDPRLHSMVFMSERLVSAIKAAKIKPVVPLVQCRVIEAEA